MKKKSRSSQPPKQEKITLYFDADDLEETRQVATLLGSDTVQKMCVQLILAHNAMFCRAEQDGKLGTDVLGRKFIVAEEPAAYKKDSE